MTNTNTETKNKKTFIKYPKIDNVKTIITRVRKSQKMKFAGLDEDNNPTFEAPNYPTLEFEGTVKMHGTHASVIVWNDGETVIQSRNRIIDEFNDNAGFANYIKSELGEKYFHKLVHDHELFHGASTNHYAFMFDGEFIGANIQAGVALNGMKKAFVLTNISLVEFKDDTLDIETANITWLEDVFDSLLDNYKDVDGFNTERLFHIQEFPTYKVSLDFNDQETVRRTVEKIMYEIEDNCPVGALLNPKSENTIGEGVVFTCIDDDEKWNKDNSFWFKVKGKKHERAGGGSRKSTQEKVPFTQEQHDFREAFFLEALTNDRLMQGIEYLNEMNKPIDKSSTGDYIKWLCQDVKSENGTLILNGMKLGLDAKLDMNRWVADSSKAFFFEYIENLDS